MRRTSALLQIINTGQYAITLDTVRFRAPDVPVGSALLEWRVPSSCATDVPASQYFTSPADGSATVNTVTVLNKIGRLDFETNGVRVGAGKVIYLRVTATTRSGSNPMLYVYEIGNQAVGSSCKNNDDVTIGCAYDSGASTPTMLPMTVVDYTIRRDDTVDGCSASTIESLAPGTRTLPECSQASSIVTRPVPMPGSWNTATASSVVWTVRNMDTTNYILEAFRVFLAPNTAASALKLYYAVGSSGGCSDRLPEEFPGALTERLWSANSIVPTGATATAAQFSLPDINVPVGASVSFALVSTSVEPAFRGYVQPGDPGYDFPIVGGIPCASNGGLSVLCGWEAPAAALSKPADKGVSFLLDHVMQYRTACFSDSPCVRWNPDAALAFYDAAQQQVKGIAETSSSLFSGMVMYIIILVALFAVILIIVLVVIFAIICTRKKKKKTPVDASGKPTQVAYHVGNRYWQQHDSNFSL
jgi:hypothetical protein